MKKYDWKNEYNPIRRTAKRLLSGEALTDGRPLSDLIELDEHTRKCLAFEATLTDRQIDMLQELGYSKEIDRCATEGGMFKAITYCNPKYTASLNKVLEILEQMELAEQSEDDAAYECEEDADE